MYGIGVNWYETRENEEKETDSSIIGIAKDATEFRSATGWGSYIYFFAFCLELDRIRVLGEKQFRNTSDGL